MVRKKILVICLVGLFFATAIGTISVNAQVSGEISDYNKTVPITPDLRVKTLDRQRVEDTSIEFKIWYVDPSLLQGDIEWDFGDGSPHEFNKDISPSHIYEDKGDYTVQCYLPAPYSYHDTVSLHVYGEGEGDSDPDQDGVYGNLDETQDPLINTVVSGYDVVSKIDENDIIGESDSLTTDELSIKMV